MSYATMQVRHICESLAGCNSQQGYNSINDIVAKAAPLIFDFDFPFYDETERAEWEQRFLLNFYTREISAETYALWKLWLNQKLNRIMPKYNPLYTAFADGFKVLSTVSTKEQITVSGTSEGTETGTENRTTEGTNHGHSTGSNTGNDKTTDKGSLKHSDTPQGTISDLESGLYMSDANVTDQLTVTESSANNSLTSDATNSQTMTGGNTKKSTGKDSRTEAKERDGYDGRSVAELMAEYVEQMHSVDELVYLDCSSLFMQYYGGVY